jgi:hypothetical protein
MTAAEHGYTTGPRNVRIKIRSGGRSVAACTCGEMTAVNNPRDGVLWHAAHVRDLPDPRVAELDRIAAELADVETQLATLTVVA